ncbi:hypothetical protein M3Y97_00934700 [Aphelenchoides bicaudatus]|nr:hypothetical protein M3Y97_00934700 [Aphelenchoides bicaudatus]
MEEDFSALRPLVKHYIVKGLGYEQVFQECVNARGHDKEYFSIDLINRWFREVEDRSSNFHDVCVSQFRGLIEMIKTEFVKAKRGIRGRICFGAKNQRCGSFKLVDKAGQLVRLDPFSYAIEVINPTTILLIQMHTADTSFDVHLLKVDCNTMELCLLSSQKEVNGFYDSCHVDTTNPNKFVIFLQHYAGIIYQYGEGYRSQLYTGSVENNELAISTKTFVSYAHAMQQCFKLEDDNICRLVSKPYDETGERVSYNKIKIGAPSNTDSEVCYVGIDEEMDRFFLHHCYYVWHKNTCYFLNNDPYSENFFIKIDVDRRILMNITWFPDVVNFSRISDMHFDENEILCICTGNQLSRQHIAHRFAVCRPDSLLNLSMQTIYEKTMFLNKNDYKEVLKALPPNLRLFNGE